MTTVDDILGAGESLHDRAKAAHAAAQEAERELHATQFTGLLDDAIDFCVRVLGISPHDMRDVEFHKANRENNFPVTTFKVSGVWFRASYAKEVVKVDTSNSYDQIDLRMQVSPQPRGVTARPTQSASWVMVKSLADLGRVLP